MFTKKNILLHEYDLYDYYPIKENGKTIQKQIFYCNYCKKENSYSYYDLKKNIVECENCSKFYFFDKKNNTFYNAYKIFCYWINF